MEKLAITGYDRDFHCLGFDNTEVVVAVQHIHSVVPTFKGTAGEKTSHGILLTVDHHLQLGPNLLHHPLHVSPGLELCVGREDEGSPGLVKQGAKLTLLPQPLGRPEISPGMEAAVLYEDQVGS